MLAFCDGLFRRAYGRLLGVALILGCLMMFCEFRGGRYGFYG